jgi:hypothetical protein
VVRATATHRFQMTGVSAVDSAIMQPLNCQRTTMSDLCRTCGCPDRPITVRRQMLECQVLLFERQVIVEVQPRARSPDCSAITFP